MLRDHIARRASAGRARVVGWLPVPKAQSRIEADVDGGGDDRLPPRGHDPQPLAHAQRRKLRLGLAHPVGIGDRGQRVRGGRPLELGGGARQRRFDVGAPRRTARDEPANAATAVRRRRPVRRTRGRSAGVPARASATSTESAPAPSSASAQRSAAFAPTRRSRARDTASMRRPRAVLRRRTCASPFAARGSGSTYRRAGTNLPAAAPDAAECWS